MGQFGIRRTTADESVKRVNIPKGTFSLFYPSKKLLLLEAIREQHELVSRKLYQELSGLAETDGAKSMPYFRAIRLNEPIF